MDFDQLRTFLLAAELQSFTQAARRLNFSQSAISQQIRDLEERLGVRLFERHSRSVSLTPAGERLQPRARAILAEVESTVSELAELKGTPQGVVRIAASTTPGIYLLPHALGAFSARYPGVRASLEVGGAEELMRIMQQGELDLAVVQEDFVPTRTFGWERVPALDDEIVLIAPPNHPWASLSSVPMEKLAEVPMIMRPPENPTRQLIFASLASAGFNPNRMRILFELGHVEGIKRSVQAGLGLGMVSRFAIASELANGQLVHIPLEDVRIRRKLWLMRPNKQRTAMTEHFASLFMEGDWLPANLKELARSPQTAGT